MEFLVVDKLTQCIKLKSSLCPKSNQAVKSLLCVFAYISTVYKNKSLQAWYLNLLYVVY